MKKFFIILCGILIMGNAFGRIDNYFKEPGTKSDYADDWGANDGGYSKEIPEFAIAGVYGSPLGTFGDEEGAIVATIARNIYKHGGYFCTTQIQAAQRNGRRYIWLEYYEPQGGSYCRPMCKKGYYGETCDLTTPVGPCDETNYENKFRKGAELKTNGKYDVTNYTKDMVVFDYKNQRASSERQAYHIVLGVVEYKEHGIKVAPVKVIGERFEFGSGDQKSRINSARSNTHSFLLCAQGYEPNENETDCIKTSWCDDASASVDWCQDYTVSEYDGTIHELKETTVNGRKCYQIRCFAGKGFKSTNDRQTCVECPGGALAYIKDDGTCGICNKGEIANSERTNCTANAVEQYSREQMKSNGTRQCWLETDGRKFAGCVHECSGTTPCYIDGKCKACD